MPKFSTRSLERLNTCHPILIELFTTVVKEYDCTILEGKRSIEQQRENVRRGVSMTLNSNHVYPLDSPSMAVDVAPYPLAWPNTKLPKFDYAKDVARYYCFGGYVMGMFDGLHLGVDRYYLRWGGDWDGDNIFIDQTFDDLVHFELRER